MKREKRCGEAVRPREMDEILEAIWTLREQGRDDRVFLLSSAAVEKPEHWLHAMVEEGLVRIEGERVGLTPTGEREGAGIIRRHRLTECLFRDVLETKEEVWEREACELEHQAVLTDEAISAVCTFLGHPPTCPHGKSIPRGPCCVSFKREIEPLVIPLAEARLSDHYRIVFMSPKRHRTLDRLAVLGILPGSNIRIHQRKPSFVVRSGETDIALDDAVVKDIYVKKVS